MATDKKTEEELKTYTIKMAKEHVKISEGEAPEDEDELDDQADDMWWTFALPDFENNPAYENLNIDELVEKLDLQTLYKETVKKDLQKKYNI